MRPKVVILVQKKMQIFYRIGTVGQQINNNKKFPQVQKVKLMVMCSIILVLVLRIRYQVQPA
jgi:hypothetical protein